jgi:zinc protease
VQRAPRLVQPEKKPSVDGILAKYETALGGKANPSKITSRLIKAQRLKPDGKTFEEEEILQKGVKMSVKTGYPSKEYGDYTVEEIYDGANVRKLGNGARIELKADEAEQIKREAQIFANPDLKAVYSEIVFDSIQKIDGKEAFLLFAKTDGNSFEKLYFDVRTGFLTRRTASTATVLGEFVYQVDYTEYRDFGGVKLPTVVKFAVPNIRWTRRILDVKNNVAIDDVKFEK